MTRRGGGVVALGVVVMVALVEGCSRDLTLPGSAGPGTVYGRLVAAQPGVAERVPVAGATVELVGTGLTATSGSGGDFFVPGVRAFGGTLLARWDSAGSGRADRQRLVELGPLGVGPGRQVGLGEVALVENARVQGKARRGDVSAPGGHAGTVVFVPQGPFTTFTGDDGSFLLRDLPAGKVQVEFFRTGYAPYVIDELELRGGESVTLGDLVLGLDPGRDGGLGAADAGPPTGSISGRLAFSPGLASAAGTTLEAIATSSAITSGTVSPEGTLTVASLPAGVYQVAVTREGYGPVRASNVLVLPGQETVLPELVLTATSASSGSGGAGCVAGAACLPAEPCKLGSLACGSAGPLCSPVANALDGTLCGQGQVCLQGACAPLCLGGASCPLQDPCALGTLRCDSGAAAPVCASSGTAADGTRCGSGQVCRQGACEACAANVACPPANPCHDGATSCDTGVAVCTDLGAALVDGTGCGPGLSCRAGVCASCAESAPCAPANDCHVGVRECRTTGGACVDTGQAAANGTPCASAPDGVCHGGTCQSCVPGAACALPGGDPCQSGALSCGSGLPVCTASGVAADLTPCSTAAVTAGLCRSGVCGPPGNSVLVPTGLGGLAGATLPALTVRVVDAQGLAVAGAVVTGAPLVDGAVSPASATTDASGQAGPFSVRLGMGLEVQRFAFSTPSAPAPGTLAVTATAGAAGTIGSLLNAAHAPSGSAFSFNFPPGGAPASTLTAWKLYSVAQGSDGTIYATSSSSTAQLPESGSVLRISPSGRVTLLAGTGDSTSGYAEGALGTTVAMGGAGSLALDEARQALYISEFQRNLVRRLDLRTGVLATIAGGGSAGAPGYGDGSAGTAATFVTLDALALGPDQALYIGDRGTGHFRRLDPSTGIITTWLAADPTCQGLSLSSLGIASSVAWDGRGSVFVSGRLCPSGDIGILRYPVDLVSGAIAGKAVRVAGVGGTSFGDGIDARAASFGGAFAPFVMPLMAFDQAGNLFFSDYGTSKVRRIDGTTFRVDTVAGTGVAGSGGDLGPATVAQLNGPASVVFDRTRDAQGRLVRPGDLLIAEDVSFSVRVLRGVGASSPGTATLTRAGGDRQTVRLDESPADPSAPAGSLPLSAVLTDAQDAGLAGRLIAFEAVDPSTTLDVAAPTTGADGRSSASPRAGLLQGASTFTASFRDLHGAQVAGSPVSFALTAVAPAQGTIFTAAGTRHASGDVAGPGHDALLTYPTGLAVASDGTVYFADSSARRLKRLRPDGVVEVVAGTGGTAACASLAEADALTAPMGSTAGLALDEAHQRLYFTDLECGLVRWLDLAASPTRLHLLAGGGPAGVPGNGDGPVGTSAYFKLPGHLTLRGGLLYVADLQNQLVRTVDVGTGAVGTWMSSAACNPAGPLSLVACVGNANLGSRGCQVEFDARGGALLSGLFCGGGLDQFYGVAAAAVDGSGAVTGLTRVVGYPVGSTAENAVASTAAVSNFPTILPLPDGRLLVLDWTRLRQVEASAPGVPGLPGTALISTVAGTAAAGSAAEYVPRVPLAPAFSDPWDVRLLPGGHLVVADGGNAALRIIW